MSDVSAGLVLWRVRGGELHVLLVHPGGPFFRKKDAGAWTIPKGLVDSGEDRLAAARREFEEETGFAPRGAAVPLTPVRLKAGKIVHAWAVEGDWDPARLRSNSFQIEWPPRSGRMQRFPEVDRAEFFTLDAARTKINPAQVPLLDELERLWRADQHAPFESS